MTNGSPQGSSMVLAKGLGSQFVAHIAVMQLLHDAGIITIEQFSEKMKEIEANLPDNCWSVTMLSIGIVSPIAKETKEQGDPSPGPSEATEALTWAICAAAGGAGRGKCDPNHCACGGDAEGAIEHLRRSGWTLACRSSTETAHLRETIYHGVWDRLCHHHRNACYPDAMRCEIKRDVDDLVDFICDEAAKQPSGDSMPSFKAHRLAFEAGFSAHSGPQGPDEVDGFLRDMAADWGEYTKKQTTDAVHPDTASDVGSFISDGLCPVPPATTSAVSTQTACDEGGSNDSAAARRMPDSESTGSLASVIAATQREDGASPDPSEAIELDLTANHTPTPWHVHGDSIVANDGIAFCFQYVASLSSPRGPERRDADAAFIARAVNSHDALVKALEQVASVTEQPSRNEIRDMACAALAAARSEG